MITRHVRGFCIATGQYSSFCVCALGLKLGVLDHMEDDDQDREDEEVREVVETRERGRGESTERTNKQTRDDMWVKIFFMSHALRHFEPQCGINTCVKVHKKIRGVRVFCSHTPVILFYWFLNFWLGLEPGAPFVLLSMDTGMGVDPVLSSGNDVGVADEFDEEEAVDRSGTTIRT